MEGPPHIEAEIEYLSTEAGGRDGLPFSGYRPQFFYRGNDWDAEHMYAESEEVSAGESVTARLRFLSPHEHHGKISTGMPFLIREGARTVGYGVVTQVFDQLQVDAATFE